ncbi:AAA+ ATPase domain [Arabidopsis thaliana x Arabidopsis arenosa]|uniref:AAA+ ATPase domain n=1 Tax=Arabidopsis thaliana x Arabidopsis arenosa TaxID=1240361 RepID=A0A8T2FQ00_9BRAS|nr:AAA+ ATPase domain [Arabidopsis thaliana x Arabidopsis arenosa]
MFPSSDFSFSPSSLFSAYASLTGFLMLFRSMLHDFVPEKLRSYFSSLLDRFFTPKSKYLTVIIDENFGLNRNQVFDAAEMYLRSKIGPETERLRVGKIPKQKHFTISIERGEEILDTFEESEVKWSYVQSENEKGDKVKRYYELTFEKKLRDKVLNSYLSHVVAESEEIKRNLRVVKLYSRDVYASDDDDGMAGGNWGCINLEHPSTFDTLAMDPNAKKKIIDDLERFLKRKEFYKRVGKAWKRGYLLYGPPGTGKSSLIAAMANYLKFDVFDLELSSIYDNGELKRVLLSTTNRSILVIEDIDCNAEVRDREAENQEDEQIKGKVTLSGILNFIDGLWSSFGDERIIVFTTNHKERLDPALLRPGRMDVHINMSYCTGLGFRTLVSNYLGLDGLNHPLCEEIEALVDSTEVTPAELAEELMQDDDTDVFLRGVISFVEKRKVERSKTCKATDDDDKQNGSLDCVKKKKKAGKQKGKGKAYASLTGFLMLFRSLFNDIVPERLRSYITDLLNRGVPPEQNRTIYIEKGEEILDTFENSELRWTYVESENEASQKEKRYYELTFEKKLRDKVMNSYLSHVVAESEEIKRDLRAVKLYSRDVRASKDDDGMAGAGWGCINLEHPSTFETLAMDPGAKKKIIDDMERFLKRREFYKRVGKAWKRGYLLYGPPGTGKSSLIAAMANYLKFDVFDLELSSIYENAQLKSILLSTTNRSILVIEDIDCSSAEVVDREADEYQEYEEGYYGRVTLSGLLNFVDGLWSSFGDERIIVFTTNHKERLDPALLRPGRMDMHINMSYCTGLGFRTLVSNYLGLGGLNHPLCEEIEALIDSTEVTPAELAEELMQEDDTDVVLRGVVSFVENRKVEISKTKELEGSTCRKLDGDDKHNVSSTNDLKKTKKKKKGGKGKAKGN